MKQNNPLYQYNQRHDLIGTEQYVRKSDGKKTTLLTFATRRAYCK